MLVALLQSGLTLTVCSVMRKLLKHNALSMLIKTHCEAHSLDHSVIFLVIKKGVSFNLTPSEPLIRVVKEAPIEEI